MVVVIEGKDWKTISKVIDDVVLSDAQISSLGLTIIERDTICDIEDQLKLNIKKYVKEALGLE